MTIRHSKQGGGPPDSDKGSIAFDFLDLPGCTTFRKDQIEHILLVRAFYEPKLSDKCPRCRGSWLPSPEVHNMEPFWDLPRGDCPVLVQLFVPVILCSGCGHAQSMEFAWLHATRQMTYRLEDYILDQAATLSTFTQIALNTGQDPNTVINMFFSTFREFDKKRGKDLPRVLEIDEVYFHGRYYTIIVDGESDAAVDLLEGKKNEVIEARLRQAGNPEAVEYVTQDFYGPFRLVTTTPISSLKKQQKPPNPPEDSDGDTFETPLFGEMPRTNAYVGGTRAQSAREMARRLLPNAKTVGDHFHFNQIIRECFDVIRKDVKDSLGCFFLERLKKTYTEEELADPSIEKKLNADVEILTKRRADELEKKGQSWSKKPKSLNGENLLGPNVIFTDHPILERAWRVKNQGLAIFPQKPSLGRSQKSKKAALAKRMEQLMDAEEAGRRLDDWVNSIDTQLVPYFLKATNLIGNWREEIIRIGTTPYSNAAAESKNRLLRMFEAIGRGLSFEQLRARLLWADAHRRTHRWPDCFAETNDRMTTQRFVQLADALLARSSKQ